MTIKDLDVKKHKITKGDELFVSKIDDSRASDNHGDILPEMNALEKVTLTYNNIKRAFPQQAVQNMF
ncbi:hypothetical protein [Soonwooa sp.]|uniref:hypothetical protein n=1 Tax=Soonwooa sp. TaxID=1938592 RepID=UPI0028B06EEC|nr:hypothetical protein [Soonwooa sp.]